MSGLVLIAACLGAGLAFRRMPSCPPGFAAALNHVVIWVSLPAMAFLNARAIAELGLLPVAAPWLVFVAGAFGFAWLGPKLGLSRPVIGALTLCCGLANTSFVGFPLIEALYGKEGLPTAVLTDQPGSFLVLGTLGLATAAAYSGKRVSWRAVLKRVAGFPPFLALVLGLFSRTVALPEALLRALESLGATLVPLALVLVGYQLSLERAVLSSRARALFLGLGYKLVLAPLLITGLYRGLLGARGLAIDVTIVEMAMAPMVSAAIVAGEHDLEPELASLVVGVGIPLSLLTAPAWAGLLSFV